MAEDPRPQSSGKMLRLLIAAAALAVIAVVAYIGSVLLFDPSLSGVSFWGGPNGGGRSRLDRAGYRHNANNDRHTHARAPIHADRDALAHAD